MESHSKVFIYIEESHIPLMIDVRFYFLSIFFFKKKNYRLFSVCF